ncbi:spore maturation protein [Thermicanus aegyptius]|uniref:spore maturation protein n=1 Tax=Thermicanus aegyptius TaxID=94009 RepID=UPI000427EFBF|nr:spore maturation protein [Thermicanus aegyptius]
MFEVLAIISTWSIPVAIAGILTTGLWKKVPIYETFIDGAKDGFDTAISIIPHLVGMLVAVEIFRDSGALGTLIGIISPLLVFFHIPAEVVPLALLRPISGAGSTAVMTHIFTQYGPDSFLGKLASIMQGSTDTTLYVLTVYFGSVGIRQYRHALAVGLMSDVVGIITSVTIAHALFG